MHRVRLPTGDNLFRVKDLKNPLAHLFTGRVDTPGSWLFGKVRMYWYLTHQSGQWLSVTGRRFFKGEFIMLLISVRTLNGHTPAAKKLNYAFNARGTRICDAMHAQDLCPSRQRVPLLIIHPSSPLLALTSPQPPPMISVVTSCCTPFTPASKIPPKYRPTLSTPLSPVTNPTYPSGLTTTTAPTFASTPSSQCAL